MGAVVEVMHWLGKRSSAMTADKVKEGLSLAPLASDNLYLVLSYSHTFTHIPHFSYVQGGLAPSAARCFSGPAPTAIATQEMQQS